MFRFEPDLFNWRREGRNIYVRNDGLARIEKQGNGWVPFIRAALDDVWKEAQPGYVYPALHAAQSAINRLPSRTGDERIS